ncbi:MAG: addiction module protein [Bifidobacteriaceae bacterium]|jgi:putative addiction module component (TIGR02574 family)|nr:addiction module protein [Bifidobacteriaceae bacterium]
MVTVALQEAVAALSRDERVELREFIDMTLGTEVAVLTDDQASVIRRRAAEMEADPSLGIPWEDVYDDLMADLK